MKIRDLKLKCNYCGKIFTGTSKLNYHVNKHTNEKSFNCDKCDKQYTNPTCVLNHKLIHLPEVKRDICGKKCMTSRSLKRHKKAHFGSKDAYNCGKCSKGFKVKEYLTYHMKIHLKERPFTCTYCEARFYRYSDRTKHVRVHTGEKPYQCKFCKMVFAISSTKVTHERTHSNERPFKCKFCSKTFTTLGNQLRHERIQTGEKPFACNICEETFIERSNLNLHMERKHINEKNYACSFSTKQDCKTHERIHTGEKPYKCEFCNQSFSTHGSNNLLIKTVCKQKQMEHQNNFPPWSSTRS